MPIAISDEQLALQVPISEWAERAGTLAPGRRLEPGSPPGTTQILLSVVAERGLGLPRET